MELLYAIVLGGAFGFVLNRVGATNPNNIINMLRLTDLHLMRAILFGIGLSSALLFAGLGLGLVDAGNLSVKAAYIGVAIGGGLLGIGFAIAGYCPGTGLGAAATGRKDGWFFVLGGLLGAFAYMLTYEWTKSAGLLDKIFGGTTTLANTSADGVGHVVNAVPGSVLGVVLGVIFMAIALFLPERLRRE